MGNSLTQHAESIGDGPSSWGGLYVPELDLFVSVTLLSRSCHAPVRPAAFLAASVFDPRCFCPGSRSRSVLLLTYLLTTYLLTYYLLTYLLLTICLLYTSDAADE